jgi:lysophospholipase L1-like esterase
MKRACFCKNTSQHENNNMRVPFNNLKTNYLRMKNNVIVLTLFVVLFFLCSNTNDPVKIFLVGDSTMAIKPERAFPENGWGMALNRYLKSNAIIENHAVNGRSSKSFMNEGRWDTICNKISAGDFVIIQFGHNDEKIKDSTRYTLPQTTYKEYLRKYIMDTRSNGGNPILCTSIVRRHFGSDGQLIDTHGAYPVAMREVAREMNVPLVDLQKLTEEEVNRLGIENSKNMFMILNPGEYQNFPDGKSDSTHLSFEGAKMVAKLFVGEVKKQKLNVAKWFE